jgi:hypothetical protein
VKVLEESSVDLGDKGKDIYFGHGYVDMAIAYEKINQFSVTIEVKGIGVVKNIQVGDGNKYQLGYERDIKSLLLGTKVASLGKLSKETTGLNVKFELQSKQGLFWINTKVSHIKVNGVKISQGNKRKRGESFNLDDYPIVIDCPTVIEVVFG